MSDQKPEVPTTLAELKIEDTPSTVPSPAAPSDAEEGGSKPQTVPLKHSGLTTPFNTPTAGAAFLRSASGSGAQQVPPRGQQPQDQSESPKTRFVSNVSAKLGKLVAEDLPEDMQSRVASLKSLDEQYKTLYTQFQEEQREIRRKYTALYAPIFSERSTIVKQVPEFWLRALMNASYTEHLVTERDEACLHHLTDIKVVELEGEQEGFRLEFFFDKDNGCFENAVLTKTYLMERDAGDLVLDKIEGCEIKWLSGQNLTIVKKTIQPKPHRGGKGHKGGAAPKVIEEPCDSFFRFFMPPELPKEEEMEEMEEGEVEELEDAREEDLEIGQFIRDTLVPEAVRYYTGEAESMEEYEVGEDDEDDGEDDGEDHEDEDEVEMEMEEEPAPRAGQHKGRKGGKTVGQVQPPQGGKGGQECKQQ